MVDSRPSPDSGQNQKIRHETRDVSVRGILGFAGGMILLAIVINLVLWWIFSAFTSRQPAPSPLTPWAASRPERLPPEPRLEGLEIQPPPGQPAPETMLQGYGWIDRPAGIVRIPIDDAMTIMVDRSAFRSTAAEEPGADVASRPPSRASSGRLIRRGQK